MPQYIKDKDTGAVHVQSPVSGGEFTFCSLSWTDGNGPMDGFDGEYADAKTYDCPDCKIEIDAARDATKGARFKASR